MATGPRSYTVAVDFVANKKQMDQIVQQFESQLAQMNPGTAFYNNMAKNVDKLKGKMQEFFDAIEGPTVDTKQLKQAEKAVENFYDTVRESSRSISNAGLMNFILSDDQKRDLNTVANKISAVKRDLRSLEGGAEPKKSSREFLDTYDNGKGRTGRDILKDATNAGVKGFNSEKSLSANAATFKSSISEAEQRLVSLRQQAAATLAELTPLQTRVSDARIALSSAEQQANTNRKTYYRSMLASQISQATTVKGLNNNYTTENVLNSILRPITKNSTFYNESGNRLTDIGRDAVSKMLSSGLQMTEAEIDSIIAGPVTGIRNSIAATIAKHIQQDENGVDLGVHGRELVSGLNARMTNYARNNIVTERVQQYTAAQQTITDSNNILKTDTGKLNSMQERYDALGQEITSIESTLIPSLQNLAVEFENLSNILKAQTTQELQDQLNNLTTQQSELQGNIRGNVTANAANIGAIWRQDRADALENIGEQLNLNLNADKAINEAETFQQNLRSSIQQWMGAGEIINYIKQGIREAYNDIQDLDKAMTNIAVVTDFSVSDLWGQINDYMAIAKQYGVATQGVYEVTQLYYQQGLGTSEVMAATTETLKMARIAGISYSDAADGMTVAIRAFNMEMEDAAHVTDVYSKVAAVTASDTQDLIEAMSKTASGAANVGSSFENTTAMIATMVD